MIKLDNTRIGVIGLGYVGLPLAVAFGQKFPTVGLDIHQARIDQLKDGHDATLECSSEELQSATQLTFSTDAKDLASCNVYIVTVPTPIDKHKRPDLTPLIRASETLGQIINRGDIVIFESTVYPGATEEVCIPVIEQGSGLNYNKDFFAGYSPERINPGDKEHRFTDILKITSGSTPEVADFVDALYQSVISAGTHKTSSIRVAEAAKVIENIQRDVNIALINELSLLFGHLGINTLEVLEAAGTKWNFLPFRPGLVGGHCIGVDPYYLTHKAKEVGYHPEMILAGRRINDGMGRYVVERVIKLMAQKRIAIADAKVLIMGFTFKENCPDLRNTRVIDIVEELTKYHTQVDVYDPWINSAETKAEYGIDLVESLEQGKYDAIIIAVAHDQFKKLTSADVRALGKPGAVLFDVKYLFPADEVDGQL